MRARLGFLLAAVIPTSALASDHLDAPAGTADPAADLADLFAWVTGDGTQVNLILTVRSAMFSNAAAYVFNITSGDEFGAANEQYQILCTFDAGQQIQCWAGDDDYASGDASELDGITSMRGRFRVFAGQRNDPFFFNRAGYDAFTARVRGLNPMVDAANCPQLTANIATELRTTLTTAPGGGPAADAHDGDTVSAIVIQIDRALVTGGGRFMSVWGASHALQ